MTDTAATAELDPRTPHRVRHELKRRQLEVREVTKLTPHMVRVALSGDDLHGFTSPGFDDHVKLFFSEAAVMDSNSELKPASRDYTPRKYDPAANILHVD